MKPDDHFSSPVLFYSGHKLDGFASLKHENETRGANYKNRMATDKSPFLFANSTGTDFESFLRAAVEKDLRISPLKRVVTGPLSTAKRRRLFSPSNITPMSDYYNSPRMSQTPSPLVHSTTFDNFEDCEIGTNLKSRNSPGRIRRTTKLVIRNACVSCKKARAKVRIHVTGLILLRMYAQRGCVQSFRTVPIQNVDSFLSVMAKGLVYGVHLDFRLQNASTRQRSTSKEK